MNDFKTKLNLQVWMWNKKKITTTKIQDKILIYMNQMNI